MKSREPICDSLGTPEDTTNWFDIILSILALTCSWEIARSTSIMRYKFLSYLFTLILGVLVLGMPSKKIAETYLFKKKQGAVISAVRIGRHKKVQLPSNAEIWYTDGSKRGNLRAEVFMRKGDNGIIITLDRYTTFIPIELIAPEAAGQFAIR